MGERYDQRLVVGRIIKQSSVELRLEIFHEVKNWIRHEPPYYYLLPLTSMNSGVKADSIYSISI